MARIWIDILTPKHARFFQPLIKRLIERGDNTFVTTREYSQANEMIDLLGIETHVYGRYGGGTLAEKLRADAERISALIDPVLNFHPDLCLSFVSPTAARVAFGLGVPNVCVSDSPHAVAVSRLTIPLARLLLSPIMIPQKTWVQYGIDSKNIVQYKAFDQVAWIRGYQPKSGILAELGLEQGRPIVTVRIEEAFASYLLGRTVPGTSSIVPVVQALYERFPKAQFVVLPRYPEQFAMLKKVLPTSVVIPDKVVDGAALLSESSLFIGAGGTMTIEAILLGVPAISFYNGELDVEHWLIERGMLKHSTKTDEVIQFASTILSALEEHRLNAAKIAHRLSEELENPVDVILQQMDTLLRSISKSQ